MVLHWETTCSDSICGGYNSPRGFITNAVYRDYKCLLICIACHLQNNPLVYFGTFSPTQYHFCLLQVYLVQTGSLHTGGSFFLLFYSIFENETLTIITMYTKKTTSIITAWYHDTLSSMKRKCGPIAPLKRRHTEGESRYSRVLRWLNLLSRRMRDASPNRRTATSKPLPFDVVGKVLLGFPLFPDVYVFRIASQTEPSLIRKMYSTPLIICQVLMFPVQNKTLSLMGRC